MTNHGRHISLRGFLAASAGATLSIGALLNALDSSSPVFAQTLPSVTSGDAYVNYTSNPDTWTLGTGKVEKQLQLQNGNFQLIELTNKASGHNFIQGSNPSSDEFAIQIDGTNYVGLSGNWTYDTYSTSTLSQGQIQLDITFHNATVQVTRHYIVYPSTGVIQEWSTYTNNTGASQNWSYPELFRQRVMQNDFSNVDMYYMTGGGNFTGSQVLKQVALSSDYAGAFTSYDDPEMMSIDGHSQNAVNDNKQGASIWNEFYALRNRANSEGIFLAFDYMGHWGSNSGNWSGNILLRASQQVSNLAVAPGGTLTTGKALTGVFSGDIDDMGNTILNYVYSYKWDYTRAQYFAQVKAYQFLANTVQTPNAFNLVNNLRYIGGDVIHIDDGWYDRKGDWNNLSGDNFGQINAYANLSGIQMTVWLPPWHADSGSSVLTQHPDWEVGQDTPTYYGAHLNLAHTDAQGNPDVSNWMQSLLTGKQQSWGSYMWRYDGQMSRTNNGSDNSMALMSDNWYALLQAFKDANPAAGIYGCSSGGESITIEAARFSDVQQTSDGNVYHYDGYWNSLLTPPDKLTSGPGSDYDRQMWGQAYSLYNRGNLGMSWQIEMNNADASMSNADKESLRKDVELYHYLKAQGVVGFGVKVYRPAVNTGDATYFLQKMSADGSKGYVTVRRYDAMIGQNIIFYPKGLNANASYTVSFAEGGTFQATNTGAYWMSNGIGLLPLKAGEITFLNLSNRPGMGSDTTPPTAPGNVTLSSSSYLGSSGIALQWSAGTDNNWLSYYEIFKNGASFDKVSIGTFYFGPSGTGSDTYQVRSVDGDQNTSALIAAVA